MPGQDWHWLRYPYLNEGDTKEKYRAVAAFLKQHSYRVAQVTISFGDYAYNAPYVRCMAKNDQAGVEQLKAGYLEGAAESLYQAQADSHLLYGRDLKHVLLLHIGSFETVMFPSLLELLRQRGFQLVTLPQAETDAAYSEEPELTSHWDGTFLEQMMRARNIPESSKSDQRLADLEKICQ
jgi:hypothetical protein